MSWLRGVIDSVLGRAKGGAESSIRAAVDVSIARAKSPPKRDLIALLAAYSAMPRLRAAVDLIGNKVAATPWAAYRTRGIAPRQVSFALRKAVEGRPHTAHRGLRAATLKAMQDAGVIQLLDTHPVLEFLDRPTPFLNAHDTRKMMQIHRELVGESFAAIERFKPVREGVLGRPAEIWPFPPSDVVELPSSATDDHFKVRMPSGSHRYIHRRDAIWMRDADPMNPYGRGVGIARTLANELDVDEYAAQTAAALFYNNGVPDTVVVVPGIGESEAKRLQERFREEHGGHLKARIPHVTDAADLKIERLSQSFADMGLVALRDAEAKIIRQTWGIPPESLGDVSNSNRATITQSDIILARLVLVPRLESWADEINSRIVPEWGDPNVYVSYESPVPTDADLEMEYAKAFGWARTFDEARTAQGLPEKGGKAGAMHLIPAGMVLVDPEEMAQPKPQPVVQPPATTQTQTQTPAEGTADETPDEGDAPASTEEDGAAKAVRAEVEAVVAAVEPEHRTPVRRALEAVLMRREAPTTILRRARAELPETTSGRRALALVAETIGRRGRGRRRVA